MPHGDITGPAGNQIHAESSLVDILIGPTLTAAREVRGLSIDDVARATRIRGTLIREIEADRFTPCGGDVYARGHIRAIAATVGADAASLVAAYDRRTNAASDVIDDQEFKPASVRPERRSPNWAAAMAVALVVICLLAAVDLLGGRGQGGTGLGGAGQGGAGTTTGATKAGEVRAPAPNAGDAAAQPGHPAPDAVAMVPQTGVSLRVRVSDEKCWVRVANGANTTVFQGVMNPSDTKDFKDSEQLRLTLGNAGAASLVVNGHDLGSPGSAGQVATVVFNRSDYSVQASG